MELEFRSCVDDAWYQVRIETEGVGGDRLRVKFVGFSDDHDEFYDADELTSFRDVEEFRSRFRPMSIQVQDWECGKVVKGTLVCAAISISPDDCRFYDAVVDRDTSFSGRPSSHSWSRKEMICSPSEKTEHDMDIGGTPYMLLVENLEKGISPFSIMEFIHQQVTISCQASVWPSKLSEAYTRGTIVVDSKSNLDKLSNFLENPDHLIISSKGRPWVMTEKSALHETARASIRSFMLMSQVYIEICWVHLAVPFRSQNLLLQLKLVEAIKQAGNNVKRFLPSEFGLDPARMGHALEPGRVTFDQKMAVRKAIEDAKIPFTYVCGTCFAGYFAGNLSQMGTLVPPKDEVLIYGDGNTKVSIMDEDDVASYTIKTIDDPRTLNKTLYLLPPENLLTQRQLEIWENLIGKKLEKNSLSKEDLLASMTGKNTHQVIARYGICRPGRSGAFLSHFL
ncbi:hypothetical protein ACLB2K_045160 [Fragaria x ananassa]